MKAFLSLVVPSLIISTLLMVNPAAAEAQYAQVQVKVERYTTTNGEINIRPYIKNVAHYAGFRLVAVDVIAGALVDTSTMTVHINNTRQGQFIQLGQNTVSYRVFPNTGFFMGQGAENILLRTTKPAYVKSVTLILTR